jgi:hypothetical protein
MKVFVRVGVCRGCLLSEWKTQASSVSFVLGGGWSGTQDQPVDGTHSPSGKEEH